MFFFIKKRLHCLSRNIWWEYLKNTNGKLVSSEITILRFTGLVTKISFDVLFPGLWPKRNEYLFYETFLWSVFVSNFHWFFRSFNFDIHLSLHYALPIKKFLTSNFKYSAGKMVVKVEGPWNTEKYCRSPWLADKKNFWILDALE